MKCRPHPAGQWPPATARLLQRSNSGWLHSHAASHTVSCALGTTSLQAGHLAPAPLPHHRPRAHRAVAQPPRRVPPAARHGSSCAGHSTRICTPGTPRHHPGGRRGAPVAAGRRRRNHTVYRGCRRECRPRSSRRTFGDQLGLEERIVGAHGGRAPAARPAWCCRAPPSRHGTGEEEGRGGGLGSKHPPATPRKKKKKKKKKKKRKPGGGKKKKAMLKKKPGDAAGAMYKMTKRKRHCPKQSRQCRHSDIQVKVLFFPAEF